MSFTATEILIMIAVASRTMNCVALEADIGPGRHCRYCHDDLLWHSTLCVCSDDFAPSQEITLVFQVQFRTPGWLSGRSTQVERGIRNIVPDAASTFKRRTFCWSSVSIRDIGDWARNARAVEQVDKMTRSCLRNSSHHVYIGEKLRVNLRSFVNVLT